jgi:hypothetical protein
MAIISSDEARRKGLIGGPVPVPAPPWPERAEDLAYLDARIADADETAIAPYHADYDADVQNRRIDALDRARRLRRIRAALG